MCVWGGGGGGAISGSLWYLVNVSVNENFSTLLDFVFFFNFWHEWVLNFILAEKENQKVLFNPSKMSLF